MKIAVTLFASLCVASAAAQPISSQPWVADLGNSQYQNPILYADYSDPDAIRVGQMFYICLLYTSPSPRDATLSRMPSSA